MITMSLITFILKKVDDVAEDEK